MFFRMRFYTAANRGNFPPPPETDGPDLDFSVEANSQYLFMGFL